MVSVLMPIYNGFEYFSESVVSLKNQHFQEWELLVGINGHPYCSEVYKKALGYTSKKIKVFDCYPIKGKSDTLHFLLEKASYDIVCLLDVDDLWLPKKLSIQLEYVYDYDVVGTGAFYFGEKSGEIEIPYNNVPKHSFSWTNPIVNSSSMFWKKDAHWENIVGVEDYEMWCRLASEGKKFFNVPIPLVKHRIHKSSAFNVHNYENDIKNIKEKYHFG